MVSRMSPKPKSLVIGKGGATTGPAQSHGIVMSGPSRASSVSPLEGQLAPVSGPPAGRYGGGRAGSRSSASGSPQAASSSGMLTASALRRSTYWRRVARSRLCASRTERNPVLPFGERLACQFETGLLQRQELVPVPERARSRATEYRSCAPRTSCMQREPRELRRVVRLGRTRYSAFAICAWFWSKIGKRRASTTGPMPTSPPSDSSESPALTSRSNRRRC